MVYILLNDTLREPNDHISLHFTERSLTRTFAYTVCRAPELELEGYDEARVFVRCASWSASPDLHPLVNGLRVLTELTGWEAGQQPQHERVEDL